MVSTLALLHQASLKTGGGEAGSWIVKAAVLEEGSVDGSSSQDRLEAVPGLFSYSSDRMAQGGKVYFQEASYI